ncbi:hypothetical protein A3H65_03975 [Candidatus Giovannonibacteria bacterium RIFCSPLOWO2_02_FULL_45_14]|nr:MAG: hypothetical protein A3H65_03975 [Candidatus Giovannonibacteria bacterium RIFCSPLOWO2_02_FULL_45_14]
MKILMFSSDPENPRLKRYAEVLDRLEIVGFERKDGRFARFWKGYRQAKNILMLERFDLITAQEIEHSFLAWLLSSKFNIPWQIQIHTDIFSPYYFRESLFNKLRVFLAKFLIPRASCIRVVSERIKRSIKRASAVLPIYSEIKKEGGINLREKYPGYDLYILMVARLSHEKNVKLALKTMNEVVKNIKALLVIVGDGAERKSIESEIGALKLENSVRLEGWQDNLPGYYASADFLLVTSNYEGYGLSAVEAISAGLPVIMTDVGVAGEIIKNGMNGFIAPVGSSYVLSGEILKVFKDADLRLKLKEGAKNTKLPYASFEDYRDKLVNSWITCQK